MLNKKREEEDEVGEDENSRTLLEENYEEKEREH